MEGPQYSSPQRTFLVVEYFKKVVTYRRDDFNTQYPGAVPPSRKTIWCKDDTDQRRHSLGFTLDRWRESPAFLAFLGLKILNGYLKCAQMERAQNSDSETHVEK